MHKHLQHHKQPPVDQQLEQLSTKLKKMQKMLPKLHQTHQSFSISTLMRSQHQNQSSQEKSIWTNTATGWTRDVQPVHAIPRAKRFQEIKPCEVDLYSELDTDLRSKLDSRGAKFSRDKRKQLFKTLDITPAPNKYNTKRYLEEYNSIPYARQLQTINPEFSSPREHIKGGTIGRFTNYPYLHYEQGIRRVYNEKLIEQARKERNKNRSFKIRMSNRRNQSLD